MRRAAREIRVAFAGDRRGLASTTVRRVVTHVLDREGVGSAMVTVCFLSTSRMRSLHQRSFGRPRSTDVIAYGMDHAGTLAADVYVCPATARQSAKRLGVSPRQELVRLVVHGALHALGYDHPDGPERTHSRMWQKQERYVTELMETVL